MEEVLDNKRLVIQTDQVCISFEPKKEKKEEEKKEEVNDQPKISEDDIGKSKIIAIFLALFLGRYGIHKFYLNQPAIGVIYLLFSRFEITMFFSLVDAFVYLFMKEETWRVKYGVKKRKKS